MLCGMSPGMAYGELGPTHHSIEDLSWLRALPGLDIVVPADRRQTDQAIRHAVRAARGPPSSASAATRCPHVTLGDGVARARPVRALRDGTDVTIIATGTMVLRALVAAAELLAADGISARVLNAVVHRARSTTTRSCRGRARPGRSSRPRRPTSPAASARAVARWSSSRRAARACRCASWAVRGFAPTGTADFLLELLRPDRRGHRALPPGGSARND